MSVCVAHSQLEIFPIREEYFSGSEIYPKLNYGDKTAIDGLHHEVCCSTTPIERDHRSHLLKNQLKVYEEMYSPKESPPIDYAWVSETAHGMLYLLFDTVNQWRAPPNSR